jgi:two-component system nitrate/nitrite response regulator NarL
MISIYIVHEMVLLGNVIASALEDEKDIKIIGYTSSKSEALQYLKENPVDIVLISSRLPDHGSMELINDLQQINQELDFIVIGISEKRETILHYVEAGASGYVSKDSSIEDLIGTIRLANRNMAVLPPSITSALMDRLSEYAEIFSDLEMGVLEKAGLTNREVEILTFLGKNMTNKEIADQLVIEVGTVKNHVHSILEKLKVSSRKDAATYLALIHRN